jgi:hypothetical protein
MFKILTYKLFEKEELWNKIELHKVYPNKKNVVGYKLKNKIN